MPTKQLARAARRRARDMQRHSRLTFQKLIPSAHFTARGYALRASSFIPARAPQEAGCASFS
jgi:hypothetical protein